MTAEKSLDAPPQAVPGYRTIRRLKGGPMSCDVGIIKSDPADRQLILNVLAREGYDCLVASGIAGGWDMIVEHEPKVVIADAVAPSPSGLELCERLRNSAEPARTFFIATLESGDADRQARALEVGCDDYLVKPFDPTVIATRVRVGVRMWEVRERLRRAAITDGLTGLYNHDHLNAVIERELNRARRYGARLAMIMIDLDFFKAVNDTYGHLVGNDTLVEVARILKENVREFDTVGRFGGEEFAVVAPEATVEDAAAICQRIRLGIADTLNVDALRGHRVTASLGFATADDARVRSAADLVDLADRALFTAKHRGRNCVVAAGELCDEDDPSLSISGPEVETLRRRVAVLSVKAKEVYVQTISSLLQALEEKDPYTARHCDNVATYAEWLARAMNLSDSLATTIRNAGLLHDVGKVGIPDRILLKPGALTEAERAMMRRVPAISVRIIDHLRILESEMHIIRHQREYYDGSGHPDGLVAEQIPIGARVLLVANAFDAMTTDRIYRPGRSIDDALAELDSLAGIQFDRRMVDEMTQLCRTRQHDIVNLIDATAASLQVTAAAF